MGNLFTLPCSGESAKRSSGHWIAIFSLVITAQSYSVQAASSEEKLTLAMAINRTLEQNPTLKLFDIRNEVLQGQLQTAELNPAYELAVDAENFAGTDNFSGMQNSELSIALSSVIEMGDKSGARSSFARGRLSFLEAQRQVESLKLLGEVTRRYIYVITAQERVDLAFEAVELTKNILTAVEQRFNIGSTPEAEVQRSRAASIQSQLTLMSEQQQLSYLKVSLTSLWGDISPQFTALEGDLFNFGNKVDFEILIAKVKQNPAIQIFAEQGRLKEAEVRLVKTESSSNINWSIGLKQLQDSNDTAIAASFSMPLFSSNRNKGKVSSALASLNAVYVDREIALLKMHAQLFRAYSNREQAIVSSKKLQSEIIPALKKALDATESAYLNGRYSYLDYVSARQELLTARRSHIDAASAALIYGANIEELTAEPLSALQNVQANFKE